MKTLIVASIVAAVLTATAMDASAKGGHAASHSGSHQAGTSHTSHTSGGSSHAGSAGSHNRAAPGVQRDSHGHIARSPKAKADFKQAHPCPSTGKSSGACPGYVIDHVVPLKRGGADHPSNMQWQTRQAAKEKDKRE